MNRISKRKYQGSWGTHVEFWLEEMGLEKYLWKSEKNNILGVSNCVQILFFFRSMSNASTTVLRCPCCRKLIAAVDSLNTQHWRTSKNSKESRKFRNYLNLVLSQKSEREGIITKGIQTTTMRNREINTATGKEDKQSLLYQTKFLLASRRRVLDNNLVSKRQERLEVQARKSLVTCRYSCKHGDILNFGDHRRIQKDFKARSNQHILPKIASYGKAVSGTQNRSRTLTGSTIARFEDTRIKLDVFLPYQ